MRGEFDSARIVWTGVLERARTSHDSARQGQALTWLGLTAYRRGNYNQARALGEQALDLKLSAGLVGDLSRSYNALGLLAWNEGRLADASALFRKASETARAAGDETGLAKAANNLALVHTELGEFAEARSGFNETLRSGRRLGDARIEGGALTNLGMLDIQMGNPGSAIASLQKARVLYRSIDYETGEQNALGQLGTAYDAMGEPRLALAALDSALEISRKEGLKQEEASNLELIAGLFRQAGDFRRALDLYNQANILNGELGLAVEQGANLRSEAEIHSVLGRPDLAQEFATKALQIHRSAGARLQELRDHLLLASLASVAGSTATAAGHLRTTKALAAALDARTARAEVALGTAAAHGRAGDPRAALRVLASAGGDLSRGDYGTASQAATLRTRAYARLSMFDSAAAAGWEAVAAVERVRGNFGSGFLRSSYAIDKSAVYADLVDVLLRLNRTAEAFEVADRGRSRALLEHLGASGEQQLPRPTLRAFAEGEMLLRRIDTLVSRLDALEETPRGEREPTVLAQAQGLAAELESSRSAYEAHLVRIAERDVPGATLLGGRRVTTSEVQRVLRPTEAVMEYFVTADRVLVFVVTPHAVRSVSVEIPLDNLARRVRLARDLLGKPGALAEADTEVLSALHDELVAPVERTGVLRGSRRLIIVPHSVLVYLPFAALRHGTTGRYFVQDYVLLHLPSAAALSVLRTAPGVPAGEPRLRARASVFVPFPRTLPASRQEALAVRSSVRGAVARQGRSATEGHLREALGAGGLIHVATHGVMNVRNPMFSRIELVRGDGASEDDGRLEVHELLGLRINAPLVFLSGCETGVGAAWSTQFARGEDYATLAQAFLYAGARAVMATLWRIGDAGAAAFAERFYAHLSSEAPAEALAAAQRELLKSSRYGSPYYWAAYQVSGDGGAVYPHSAAALSVQQE